MSATEISDRALEIHKPFHRSAARYKCMIGGVGSGKSYALCAEAIAFALEQPGSDMLIARRHAPALRDSTEAIFFQVLPHELREAGAIQRAGGHVNSYEFPNGSLLKFRGVDDWTKHKSQNLSWIGFDEADEQSEANLDGMSTRLRQETPLQAAAERGYETTLPMRRQVCLASNPAGKDWLWRRFINAETRDQRGEGFISTTLDNPFLPVDFIEDQLSKPAAFVRRYVLCLFDELAGAIYPEWCDDHRVAWAPPKQEGHMDIWQSFDPGTTQVNPSSCQWAVVDREHQRLVVIAEYEGHDSAAAIHAKRWREIEKGLPGKVTWRTADPAAIGARDRGSNMTLMDIYRRLGFSFDPARSNRHEVRVPALGELIALGRFGVTADCPISFGQIQGYSWEDQLPKDLDLGAYRDKVKKGKDGMVDCAQYLAQRWIWRASTMPEEKDDRTPEELFSAHVHATISRTLKPQRGNLAPGVIVA